jgi:hypothetical protein
MDELINSLFPLNKLRLQILISFAKRENYINEVLAEKRLDMGKFVFKRNANFLKDNKVFDFHNLNFFILPELKSIPSQNIVEKFFW